MRTTPGVVHPMSNGVHQKWATPSSMVHPISGGVHQKWSTPISNGVHQKAWSTLYVVCTKSGPPHELWGTPKMVHTTGRGLHHQQPCPVYYVSFLGLDQALHDLISIEQLEGTTIPALLPASTSSTFKNINAQGGVHGDALQVASYRGHEKVVQMLLDKGADVNAQGRYLHYRMNCACNVHQLLRFHHISLGSF